MCTLHEVFPRSRSSLLVVFPRSMCTNGDVFPRIMCTLHDILSHIVYTLHVVFPRINATTLSSPQPSTSSFPYYSPAWSSAIHWSISRKYLAKKNSPSPQGRRRALGNFLLQGPRGALFLMSEVPLYSTRRALPSSHAPILAQGCRDNIFIELITSDRTLKAS
jgi:hypothetical protein